MRKYIIGGIVGLCIGTAGTTYAGDIAGLIGSKVQGTTSVMIDGSPIDAPAPIINGSSYLPVRALGEALGKDVEYNPKTGVSLVTLPQEATTENIYESMKIAIADILIEQQETSGNSTRKPNLDFITRDVDLLKKHQLQINVLRSKDSYTPSKAELDYLDVFIQSFQQGNSILQKSLAQYPSSPNVSVWKDFIEQNNAYISDYQTQKAALEAKVSTP